MAKVRKVRRSLHPSKPKETNKRNPSLNSNKRGLSTKGLRSATSKAKERAPTRKSPLLKPLGPASKKMVGEEPNHKISPKLLEVIQRRKQQMGQPPKIRGRRGRKPKALTEYLAENQQQEEEGFPVETDYAGLEYDTGIDVKQHRDDNSMTLERFEEYDEELNFDW